MYLNRITQIRPEPSFLALQETLAERLKYVSGQVNAKNFDSFLDPLMKAVLNGGFSEAGAHEGTVWLLDSGKECLVPAYNTGARASEIVGHFKQPVDSGLICMVFATEQPFMENEVFRNVNQSKLLDTFLGVKTYALIAVPFYFFGSCRGVISCVQLLSARVQEHQLSGFNAASFEAVERASVVLRRLIEYHLISLTIGWNHD